MGNGGWGIQVQTTATGSVVGDPTGALNSSAANIIQNNALGGVDFPDGSGNVILSNSIDGPNAGIVLGPTANLLTTTVAIAAPSLQDTPVAANSDGTADLYVEGFLNEPLAGTYTVQIFSEPTNSANGRTLVGNVAVTVAPGQENTNVPFGLLVTLPTLPDFTTAPYITATATLTPTASTGGTSEFSNALREYNGLVVTNTNDAGPGSLRGAIGVSNLHPGLDTITFAIPAAPLEIDLKSGLSVLDPVVIDATTQGARVVISGKNFTNASNPGDLLTLTSGTFNSPFFPPVTGLDSSGSTAEGLAFVADAFGAGVRITTDNNTLVNDDFGTPDLATKQPLAYGVLIDGSSGTASNNHIGGGDLTDAKKYNVFVAITNDAVLMQTDGGHITQGTGNAVSGNFIGALPTGAATGFGNGIGVVVLNAGGNTVGGATAKAGNVLSGNTGDGVQAVASGGATIENNLIGLAPDGVTALGNTGDGVEMKFSTHIIVSNNLIAYNANGVSSTGSGGNQITGGTIHNNNLDGVLLSDGGNIVSSVVITDNNGNGIAVNNSANNTITGDTVTLNNLDGVIITGASATGNLLTGNFIGTDATGTNGLANQNVGVRIVQASGNTLGGATAADRNVISGNFSDGVFLSNDPGANTIQGNYIGVAPNGTTSNGNLGDGVELLNSPSQVITANLIAYNDYGVYSVGSGSSQITGGTILHNVADGVYLADDGNTVSGVLITDNGGSGVGGYGVNINGGANNTITGDTITLNGGGGVLIAGVTATGNTVSGSNIGTDNIGAAGLGNTGDGVYLNGAPSNTVSGNVISGNTGNGVEVNGGGSEVINSNLIGVKPGTSINFALPLTDSTANNLPNTGSGVYIHGNSSKNIIGADTAADSTPADLATDPTGNVIYYTAAFGVNITDGNQNQILSNAIYGTGQGIFLGAQANILAATTQIAAPTLVAVPVFVTSGNVETMILGKINEPVAGNYLVQIFFTDAASSTSSNGKRLIATREITVTTPNTDTLFCIHVTLPDVDPNLANTNYVTATATSEPVGAATGPGATSIFSNALQSFNALVVTSANDVATDYSDAQPTFVAGVAQVTLRKAIYYSNLNNDPADTITFAIPPVATSPEIDLVAPLTVLAPVTIDGTSQGARVIVSGKNLDAVTGAPGLLVLDAGNFTDPYCEPAGVALDSSGSTIKGMAFVADAFGAGVVVRTGTQTLPDVLSNDYFGTADGTTAAPDVDGVDLQSGDFNVVGPNSIASFNTAYGINITGGGNDTITTSAINQNGLDGVFIAGTGANTLTGNTIDSNLGNGVNITVGGNTLTSNDISLNKLNGVLATVGNNQLTGNNIDSNTDNGVYLNGSANNTLTTNTITRNGVNGVLISGNDATGNTLTGNFIGTNAAGIANYGNKGDGVNLFDSDGNTIGTAVAGNTIAGNLGNGIQIVGNAPAVGNAYLGNTVAGNFIGTNAAALTTLGNALDGVLIVNASDETIGTGNTIMHNTGNGVQVQGNAAPVNTVVLGNTINGDTIDSNKMNGVYFNASASNTLSGSDVSINTLEGVLIAGANAGNETLTGNTIISNRPQRCQHRRHRHRQQRPDRQHDRHQPRGRRAHQLRR